MIGEISLRDTIQNDEPCLQSQGVNQHDGFITHLRLLTSQTWRMTGQFDFSTCPKTYADGRTRDEIVNRGIAFLSAGTKKTGISTNIMVAVVIIITPLLEDRFLLVYAFTVNV